MTSTLEVIQFLPNDERDGRMARAPDVATLEFWKQSLVGIPPLMLPPHGKPRPTLRTDVGETRSFEIQPELSRRIAAISAQAGVAPAVTLLAVLQALLLRWTGQSDVCIGALASIHQDSTNAPFTNTLVLRTSLVNNPTFLELLARSAETVTSSLRHGDVPFDKLVLELNPERIPGGNPLFQVLYQYLKGEWSGSAESVWNLTHSSDAPRPIDCTLTIEDGPDRMQAHFGFSADLYDAEAVNRYVGHFQVLLEAIVARPESRLSELPILPVTELERILRIFNASAGEYPSDTCVHQLVEEQVLRTPDAIAFVCRNETLTYRELNERANQLAHHLRSLGVGPDTLIGLCVERSLEMPVAMLGILKSGGAYVPLDPDFPQDRLDFYVRDSNMSVIVAHQQLLQRLPADGIQTIRIDADRAEIARRPTTNPEPTASPENLVYVLYTSGSTGKPNGVAIEHRSLCNLLWSFRQEPGLRASDTILSVTTLSFDIHTVETWLPMIVGARTVIATSDVKIDGRRLIELVNEADVTVMQSTPATWRMMLAVGWNGKRNLRAFTGGEALTTELAYQLHERCQEVWNVYGPTETTVWSVIHRVAPEDRAVFIGHPVLNTQIYVLDPQRQPVPIGCVGEIWIGGDGLARGYLGRPNLNAERFVSWTPPALDQEQPREARIYKTGDLGRFHPNGTLECLGRVDHQVKVRGFRIELSEIERVLEQHEELAQAVVVVRPDDKMVATLHAYYRCQNGRVPSAADLRKFVQGRLPDYMTPATFTVLVEFPHTPNGKVDRKALPAPAVDSAVRTRNKQIVPPANDAEQALLAIWEEVFGIKPLGVLDNFHELGGHSLRAAVLMSRIEKRLGHRLAIEALFQAPTVRGLAEVIQRKLELGSGVMVPLQTGGTQPPLFMIAGVGGHVFQFHKFARLLGSDFVSYGMKAVGVDGSEPPLENFEEIASRYVKEILAECRNEPYLLSGYSVGGRIALEVALQLQEKGKYVPKLIVFDEFAPGSPRPLPLLSRTLVHSKRFWNNRNKGAFLKDRYSALVRRLTGKRQGLINVEALDVVPQRILQEVEAALMRGNQHYFPKRKFKGQVILIKSSFVEEWESAVYEEPFKGWHKWSTEPVLEYTIAAEHMHMFDDEHQEVFAPWIRALICATKHDLEDMGSGIRDLAIS